jgi:carboxypeptidase Taq
MMPTNGAQSRASQRATVASLYHEKLTDPGLAALLDELAEVDLKSIERSSLRELRREVDRAVRIPKKLVQDLAETEALAYESWVGAREASDFSVFAPWLEKLIRLKREKARCIDPSSSLYENLLDEYEPGMKERQLEELFSQLRPQLTALLQRIISSPVHSNIRRIQGIFPVREQENLGREILTAMGFNWKAGRLDRSPHPFCTGLAPEDVRITTRYSEDSFLVSVFGTIHEGGHALYEQGLDSSLRGLPICDSVSLGLHESQSRLWENQVGRSRPFWSYWLPRARALFPSQLDGFPMDDFVLAVNLVEPSPIRVTADEVSYGLHVLLRFDLERALLNGELDVQSLPEAWCAGMQDYLGLRPRDDAEGVLQDTHWSQGLLGYFPTYLLGNLYAAQLVKSADQAIPNLESKISNGELLPLRSWLQENVHILGKVLTAEELMQKVTGEPLNAHYFLRYLDEKYSQLYDL